MGDLFDKVIEAVATAVVARVIDPDPRSSTEPTVIEVVESPRPGSMGAMIVEQQRRLDRIGTLMRENKVNDPEFANHCNRIIRELYQLMHLGGDYWDEAKWEIKAVRRRVTRKAKGKR
jgi:hypothetical protein